MAQREPGIERHAGMDVRTVRIGIMPLVSAMVLNRNGAAESVCSPSIYAAAAQQCSLPVTPQPARVEGTWFDGVVYDPTNQDVRAPA